MEQEGVKRYVLCSNRLGAAEVVGANRGEALNAHSTECSTPTVVPGSRGKLQPGRPAQLGLDLANGSENTDTFATGRTPGLRADPRADLKQSGTAPVEEVVAWGGPQAM